MMCYGQERGKKFWIKRAIFIPIAIAAGVFIFGSVVMLLWNGILPAVIGVSTITFWQALGILALSKILFGGFGGAHGHHKCNGDGHERKGRWMHLSPEERETMKEEWRSRCGAPEQQV
jgi:Ca2+/H+ antiporter, TMEM165/GDT1 family